MKTILNVKIETILFLDIETVPNWKTFEEAPENVQKEWIYKYKFRPDAQINEEDTFYYNYFADLWIKEAGFKAEFARIVCISVGYMYEGFFNIKSYNHANEGELLNAFKSDLASFSSFVRVPVLCAHYGKGFDFPFISRRMLINRIKLPPELDTAHLKPWEQVNLDTQELWKMGAIESAGLPALCMAFGLETPKEDLDGSMVREAYYNGEIQRITIYCEKDIFALVNVFKAFRYEEPLTEDKINII